MKKFIYILPIMALALASCDNFFDEHQLGNTGGTITDVRTFTYTLTDNDYASIASNETNISTMVRMAEDSSLYEILQELKTNKYYSDTIVTPDLTIPAFLGKKYPYLTSGTICDVTYKTVAEKPDYFADFKIIREVVLTTNPADDAAAVEEIKTLVTSTSTLRKYVVHYNDNLAKVYYYNGSEFVRYETSEVDTMMVLPLSFYREAGVSTASQHYLKEDNMRKVINIYLSGMYPYAAEGKTVALLFNMYVNEASSTVIYEFTFDGENWLMGEDVVEETMSFEMKNIWKANTSTYLSEPFLGHGIGNFTTQDVLLTGGLTYVWYYSASYGMCASAYKNSTNNESESWLVSPKIKLKKAVKPALIFDQARKYGVSFADECTIWVSADYAGDVKTATWTQLPWNKLEDGTPNVPDGSSWIFQTSDYMDMSAFVGKTVHVAFRYTSSTEGASNWEIKNVLVCEIPGEEE